MSQEEVTRLRQRVRDLEEEVQRLRGGQRLRAERPQRPFDFGAHPRQHVALRLAYLGWSYQGFASQENTRNTVEEALFSALTKTRLVQNRQNSNYHRCGRTDRGVSALGQVVSLDLRSSLRPDDTGVGEPGIRYVHILNRVLPPDIRVLSWAPVPPSFSARFSCRSRTYRYIFPRAQLDVARMDRAAQLLHGTHDFRNLCKMDVANGVLNFTRTVLSARVGPLPETPGATGPYQLYQLQITGLAFLYHQVRCIMGVLFLIGQRREEPEVMKDLLDVHRNPRKPQYNMAVELPLVLYDCHFDDVPWVTERDVTSVTVSHLQRLWTQEALKAQILYMALSGRDTTPVTTQTGDNPVPGGVLEPRVSDQSSGLIEGVSPRSYTPLMKRQLCQGLEERVQHYVRRGRIKLPSERDSWATASSERLPGGGERLPEGSERLPEGSERLPEGSERLPEGSERLPEGSERLPEGSERLPEGSERLPERSERLPEGGESRDSERLPGGSERLPEGSESRDSERLPEGSESRDSERLPGGSERLPEGSESRDSERLPGGSERLPEGSESRDSERLPEGSESRDSERLPGGSERLPGGSERLPEGSESTDRNKVRGGIKSGRDCRAGGESVAEETHRWCEIESSERVQETPTESQTRECKRPQETLTEAVRSHEKASKRARLKPGSDM
ncbi:tRNA pseudouridine(38/39) synthase [Ascaphus truei]|uniref:tRNA pseudouridine(38/39) synthase n=1 Tax=Ascaphus truei TaxID=8439 RepID=UPI003F5926DF